MAKHKSRDGSISAHLPSASLKECDLLPPSPIDDRGLDMERIPCWQQSSQNAHHLAILNDEVGTLRDSQIIANTKLESISIHLVRQDTDLTWIKRIGYFIIVLEVSALGFFIKSVITDWFQRVIP